MPLVAGLFILALINLFAFGLMAVALGGDALGGKREGGHYYLSNRGRLTEVSAGVYWYSFVHAISAICTHTAFAVAFVRPFTAQRRRSALLSFAAKTSV